MCGLVGWISKNQGATALMAREYVTDQYEDQHGRGQRGFGIIEIAEDGKVTVQRSTEPIKFLIDLRMSKARHILLHHRLPTSTENYIDQTHPIEVEHEELKSKWYVMHNGHISNADELKKEHEALGYVYLTEYLKESGGMAFNDTEAFAIDLARFLEGATKEMSSRGGFAFMAVATDQDDRVMSIYIGSNSSSNMGLFEEESLGFAFASEELRGTKVKADEFFVFDAKYETKEITGSKNKQIVLTGFQKRNEEYKLKTKTIVSPISREYENRWQKRSAGFHEKDPKEGAGAKAKENAAEDVTFDSFGHIVNYIARSKITDVFRDTEMAQHVAVEQFNITDFNRFITSGEVEKAEDIYNKYISDSMEFMDTADALEEALEPQETKIGDHPTVADIVNAGQDVTGKRMAKVAHSYLPFFKVCTYAEVVINLGYQFQVELTTPKKEKKNESVEQAIDNADPDKYIDDQVERDVAEMFPGKDDRTTQLLPEKTLGKVRELNATEELERDAIVKITALKGTLSEMEPDDIYREAEETADAIRIATEAEILDYLAKITTCAGEDGLPLQIPFHIHMIRDVLTRAERRFTDIAQVVKATREKDEVEGDRYIGS